MAAASFVIEDTFTRIGYREMPVLQQALKGPLPKTPEQKTEPIR